MAENTLHVRAAGSARPSERLPVAVQRAAAHRESQAVLPQTGASTAHPIALAITYAIELALLLGHTSQSRQMLTKPPIRPRMPFLFLHFLPLDLLK